MRKKTEKPYGYLLIDNQPKTTSDKQVVADVFGNCQSYPHMTTGTKALQVKEISLGTPETGPWPIEQSEVKHKGPNQSAKKSKVSGKRKVELEKPPAKRKRSETKQTKRKVKTKSVKSKRTQKKQPTGYKPKFMVSPTRESSDEDQFSSEEEQFSSETQEHLSFEQELTVLQQDTTNLKEVAFDPSLLCIMVKERN